MKPSEALRKGLEIARERYIKPVKGDFFEFDTNNGACIGACALGVMLLGAWGGKLMPDPEINYELDEVLDMLVQADVGEIVTQEWPGEDNDVRSGASHVIAWNDNDDATVGWIAEQLEERGL